jgi:hypothetical protein
MQMRRITLILLTSICLLFFLSAAALAQGGKKPSRFIYVDAVGGGLTKEEALNAAFSEAVRKAVGAYLVSNTTVKSNNISDEVREQIILHSRGIIVSYIEIYSENKNSLWTVAIKAEIERNMMEESVNSIMQVFYKPKDNSVVEAATRWQERKENEQKQIAAQRYSEEQQKKSATDLVNLFIKEFNMDNILTVVSTEPVFNEEKESLNIKVKIKYTDNIYNLLFINKLKNLLRIISKSSKEQYFNSDQIKKNRSFDRRSTGDIDNAYNYQEFINPFGNDASVIFIIDNFGKYTAYLLDNDIYKLLYDYFEKTYFYLNAIIDVKAFDFNNQLLDNNISNIRLDTYFYILNKKYLYFRPVLVFGGTKDYVKELEINIPLDIPIIDIQNRYHHHTVDLIVNFSPK